MIPWAGEDYTMDECQRQKAELIASGKYAKVVIYEKEPEGGKRYGRVFVMRKSDTETNLPVA